MAGPEATFDVRIGEINQELLYFSWESTPGVSTLWILDWSIRSCMYLMEEQH